MNQLTIVAKVSAKKGKEKLALKALQTLVNPTLKEAGCIEYKLHESADNPGEFLFYESWENEAYLQQHLKSAHVLGFREKAVGLVEGAAELSRWNMSNPK